METWSGISSLTIMISRLYSNFPELRPLGGDHLEAAGADGLRSSGGRGGPSHRPRCHLLHWVWHGEQSSQGQVKIPTVYHWLLVPLFAIISLTLPLLSISFIVRQTDTHAALCIRIIFFFRSRMRGPLSDPVLICDLPGQQNCQEREEVQKQSTTQQQM